jgi:hypothetical protein
MGKTFVPDLVEATYHSGKYKVILYVSSGEDSVGG